MAEPGAGRFVVVAVFVTSITALSAALIALWAGGDLNTLICDGDCGAEAAALPDALTVTPTPAMTQVSAPPAAKPDANAVRTAVAEALADAHLGTDVGFAAVDPRTGEVLATHNPVTFTPASTTKLLTAFAVLATLDPQQRFVTSVVRSGNQLVLVGGGDPYLMTRPLKDPSPAIRADLRTLAGRTATVLQRDGVGSVQLGYDATLFTGPALNPTWEESYVAEQLVTPISPLWADQVLRSQPDDAAESAADDFAELLIERGIDVTGDRAASPVPPGAMKVAEVSGATLAQATERMIAVSDNDAAEILLRHVAIGSGRPGTFADGVSVVRAVLRNHGIDVRGLVMNDGSGLSRANRISPLTLAQVIATAAGDARTAPLVSDLPVARFSGSLKNRFDHSESGGGLVRAKTGTLTGVHSLAGYATDRTGTPIAFAVMVDNTKEIPSMETEAALDRVGAALARCACSRLSRP